MSPFTISFASSKGFSLAASLIPAKYCIGLRWQYSSIQGFPRPEEISTTLKTMEKLLSESARSLKFSDAFVRRIAADLHGAYTRSSRLSPEVKTHQ